MGNARGKPRKKLRSSKNPFDLGLSKLKLDKKGKTFDGKMVKEYVKKLDREIFT